MNKSLSELGQVALEYARDGIKIFPCVPNAKLPACAGGFKAATADLAQVEAWWREMPDANIALVPEDAGWAVVDVEGTAPPNWAQGNLIPKTYTVRTPRQGKHYYFAGSVPSTVRFLPDVDTRGKSGYVLVAPSVVNGKAYEVIDDSEPAPLPRWVKEKIVAKAAVLKAQPGVQLDLLPNVVRGIKFLKSLEPVKEGDGSDDAAYKAATTLRELGLSGEKAIEVMMEHWRCEPKEIDWLAIKVQNAYNYGQNEPGASAIKPAAETFAGALPAAPKERGSRFRFKDAAEMCTTPPQQFIVPDLIPENSIVLLSAQKGNFKTYLALDIGHAIATGCTTAFGIKPSLPGPVFYGAHEGRFELELGQRKAWCIKHGIKPEVDHGFYVAPGPRVSSEEDRQEFGDQIKLKAAGRKPRLIIIDTYSASMLGWDENNPDHVNRFIVYCRELIEAFPGGSVLVCAHYGKNAELGTRGSSALEAGVDTVLEVNRHEKTTNVTVRVRYHRNASDNIAPWHLEGKPVAGNLVFQSVTPEEHEAKVKMDKMLTAEEAYAALTALNALGPDKGRTTHVLAMQLRPMAANESQEYYEKQLAEARKMLGKLGRGRLRGYFNSGLGKNGLWHLPASVGKNLQPKV